MVGILERPLRICLRCKEPRTFQYYTYTASKICQYCVDPPRLPKVPKPPKVPSLRIRRKGRMTYQEINDKYFNGTRNLHHFYNVQVNYGITLDEFIDLLEEAQGKCAICEYYYPEDLQVDHDHETGRARGMLCPRCNKGLGHFGDHIPYLAKAIEYLSTT